MTVWLQLDIDSAGHHTAYFYTGSRDSRQFQHRPGRNQREISILCCQTRRFALKNIFLYIPHKFTITSIFITAIESRMKIIAT